MLSWRKKVSENLIFFTLISFVFLSVLGIGVGMEMKDGHMSSCPFMAGQETMCKMKITEHITQWRKAFLGIPTKGDTFTLAVLLFIVALIPFVKLFFQFKKLTKLAARLFAYHTSHLVKVFDPLLIAFSYGILNPKIY